MIALADHNTGDWLDDMKVAGERHGVIVFPGVEVTTGSGSDGVHLLLIGELDRSKHDIDLMLAQTCGFNEDHPRLNPKTRHPAPAPHTVTQILDNLPEGWLAVAPHALNDNGIASKKTIQGDLRWKALHHDRLGAIDVGDVNPSDSASPSWAGRFRSRRLDDLPCIRRLPFIATSDAYSLDELGSRYTWIRMDSPSKEALRQAFLDYEARIIPSWDVRLRGNSDPNVVDHAWVERVRLGGDLGNSSEALEVRFDPRLNVIIGGRGAGKSTIVAALRQLYGRLDLLPPGIQREAQVFVEGVFRSADLSSCHRIAISRETGTAQWSAQSGSQMRHGNGALATTFPMSIFSQKELFERTAQDHQDRFAASRHLFTLVDSALEAESGFTGTFQQTLEAAQTACLTSVAERLNAEVRLSRRPEIEARIRELQQQVSAFGDAESQSRRRQSEEILREQANLASSTRRLTDTVHQLEESLLRHLEAGSAPHSPATSDVSSYYEELNRIRDELERDLRQRIADSLQEVEAARKRQQSGDWAVKVESAERSIISFQEYMNELGIDPATYLSLTESLNGSIEELRSLDEISRGLDDLRQAEARAWSRLQQIYENRSGRREKLLHEVEQRSGSLRFEVNHFGNTSGWVREVRELLGIRADGFVEDIPALAEWIWETSQEVQSQRLKVWRECVLSGTFEPIKKEVACRVNWWSKLVKLDTGQRIRLAMLYPDDVVHMYFLRDGGNVTCDGDWQSVTTSSPGQRSAAMLSFVLHHGVEPLVLDQPEDDLDTAWISQLIVPEIRKSRWVRQVIVVTHNANIPVNADAERVIVVENDGDSIRVKSSKAGGESEAGDLVQHAGSIEVTRVRRDIQDILEGGTEAFMARERRYNNELSVYRAALRG
nr:AAA family ATPase [Streptomyces sp. YIM 98790]